MSTVPLPTFSDVVEQAWFIEPLGGPTPPRNYLDRFPEEVYNKSIDSHLVRFMYAMLGPAGVGWLKKNLLDARLALEDYGFELFDIERFYGDPIRFGRILDELYTDDPTGVLPREDWDRIKARDEQYRSRATRFMQGARLGNSPQGLKLVAESALGYPADLVENYKYLFDIHSDDPLGLDYFGKTFLTNEFIVRPKPDVSRSEVQTLTISGDPTGGNFVLIFNGQQTTDFTYTPLTSSTAIVVLPAATVLVTNTGGFPSSGSLTVGSQTVAYTGLTETSFTGCTGGVGSQPVGTLVSSAEATYSSIPWNAPAGLLRAALVALTNLGEDDVFVTGGPIPNPYTIRFGGGLSNQDVPLITAINSLTGGSDPDVVITTATGGLDAATESVTISPRAQHNLQTALDYIRSVPSIPSYYDSSGGRSRQDWATAASSSTYTEVVRYVTGAMAVNWPTSQWIEAGVEVEAPRAKDDRQHHYVGFHNIDDVTAYTDEALDDGDYESDEAVLSAYNSEHVGPFTPEIQRLIPFFAQQDPSLVYAADRIKADYAEPLTVTSQTANGTTLINGIYPSEYATLPNVSQIAYRDEQFWASRERTSGSELVEIDLGSVHAVNFLTFEAIRKPIDIEVAYDIYDQSPRRRFVDVTPDTVAPYENSLNYDPLSQSPWYAFEYHFSDALGGLIFTRFLRLKITRKSGNDFLFDTLSQVQTPWSIEVRNLRIGRNVVDV